MNLITIKLGIAHTHTHIYIIYHIQYDISIYVFPYCLCYANTSMPSHCSCVWWSVVTGGRTGRVIEGGRGI